MGVAVALSMAYAAVQSDMQRMPVAWDKLEEYEFWADGLVSALPLATEDDVDERVHKRMVCPMCGEGFIDGAMVLMPPQDELAHRGCVVGWCALSRAARTDKGSLANTRM